MPQLSRRSLLPAAAGAVTVGPARAAEAAPRVVRAGADREGRARSVGVSATTYKVLTAETGGDSFVMEQTNHKLGGPSRHLHHGENEFFYVLEGRYDVEIGGVRSTLGPGDCILGLKGVPHAWAFTGRERGRLLLAFAPAGKMEAFFNSREAMGIKPGRYGNPESAADRALLHAFGMELVGPPLALAGT